MSSASAVAWLSHKKPGVAGVYNKAQYLPQRTTMMQWYANYLDGLAGGVVVQGDFGRQPKKAQQEGAQ